MLKREVLPRPSRVAPTASMFVKLIAGSFIVGVLGSVSFAPRTTKCHWAETRVDVAVVVSAGEAATANTWDDIRSDD